MREKENHIEEFCTQAVIHRFHGNDRGEAGIGVEDINDLCLQCREELGVMDLLGFGE